MLSMSINAGQRLKNKNFFETNAGPEELEHVRELLEKLTLDQLKDLFMKVGIRFIPKPGEETSRESYEISVGEADREDFYREYRKILQARERHPQPT
jgi:hypothetical protein